MGCMEISNGVVERLSLALVREFLYRKGLVKSLRILSEEAEEESGGIHSRLLLAKELRMGNLMKINKRSTEPLRSMLEVLVKHFAEDFHSPRIRLGKGEKVPECLSPQTEPTVEFSRVSPDFHPNDSATALLDSSKVGSQKNGNPSNVSSGERENHKLSEEVRNISSLAQQSSSTSSTVRTMLTNGSDKGKSSLLEDKKNVLASASLTERENVERKELNRNSEQPTREANEPNDFIEVLDDLEDNLELDFDINDFENEFEKISNEYGKPNAEQNLPNLEFKPNVFDAPKVQIDKKDKVKFLDMKSFRELKLCIFGKGNSIPDGWTDQGFTFDYKIPFGLVQKKGGPCGVLAAVQALTLRNLMFGSEFCDKSLPMTGNIVNYQEQKISMEIANKKSLALEGAITEILWRCGKKNTAENVETFETSICLGKITVGSEYLAIRNLDSLKSFVKANLHRIDCLSLVYSAVLSRDIQIVQDDMDFSNSSFLGQHGYCSQELVNLLTIGTATSNAFDGQVLLGDKILKGIEAPCDIGFLSLFEHYNSCQVGNFLKNPRFPLWIVCSESHFSILFSNSIDLVLDDWQEELKMFELFYYDGLGRQQSLIKMTITLPGENEDESRRKKGNNNQEEPQNDDLIPPLEKCIRTKWKKAGVNWNDTEPIL